MRGMFACDDTKRGGVDAILRRKSVINPIIAVIFNAICPKFEYNIYAAFIIALQDKNVGR
ncbi:hypothetical protein LPB140_00200 [Sphingorhabdus lutea]|uniref:Uncharacterized protein n=1 Tax=Sphingorhabdus lutea TaxID=1913578 RepID=A0A1L3J8Q9_9SPHN|nr:hypothetical protein LPB140_00200 [Sphingorhabdus lutea]